MRFHVLGLGPVGTLVAHHLCKTIDTTKHGVVLIHKFSHQLRDANLAGNTLKVERDGIVDTSTAFRSEVWQATRQYLYEKRQTELLALFSEGEPPRSGAKPGGRSKAKAKAKAEHIVSRSSIQDTLLPIESLIVAVKAYTVVESVKALVSRLTRDSTIVLLHNGMGIYERLIEDVFRNPEQRPHFIVAVNDHGAWAKGFLHTVHAGMGSITFGIVADPRGRKFEVPSVTAEDEGEGEGEDEDVPRYERALSLDAITSPEECDDEDSPYLSLRNTVAALSNLSGLNATWKPVSHVETAMKRKLVINSVINPLTALIGCRNGDLTESAEAQKIIKRVCKEAALAFAMQAQQEEGSWNDHEKRVRIHSRFSRVPPGLDAQALEEECGRVIRATATNISSMLCDVRKGSHTEVDYMNGYLAGLGRSFNLPMTTTGTLLNLVKMRSAIPSDRLIYK